MFRIGNQLSIEQLNGQNIEEYKCTIMDFQENQVIVDYPIHINGTKRFSYAVQSTCKARYINDAGQLFLFDVTITFSI